MPSLEMMNEGRRKDWGLGTGVVSCEYGQSGLSENVQ